MNRSANNRRLSARLAAVGAAALLAGMLPGTGSEAREQTAKVTVSYDCAFPSGAQRVQALLSADFPEAAAPGKPLQPRELSVEVKIPQGALGDLLPAGTGTVTSEAALTVRVVQGDSSADAKWEGLKAEPTPVPESGELSLSHKGDVPPVTVAEEGDVTFTAGDLALDLTPEQRPTGEPSTLPAKAPPSAVCRPAPDQDLRLATVRVRDQETDPSSPSPSDTPKPSAPSKGSDPKSGPSAREGGIDVGDEPLPPAKPCATTPPTAEIDKSKIPPLPPNARVTNLPGVHWCAVPVAVSNVTKLNGAMVINDPMDGAETVNLRANQTIVSATTPQGNYNSTRSVGEIDLPDSTATFLDFDFMPVTAQVEFISSPLTIITEQRSSSAPNYASIYMSQTLRMHDVKVNGQPLPVGPDCRTSRPIDIQLKGATPEYSVLKGGVLRAKLDIPPFSGCGTGGEDLDSLFTAAISGSGNYLKMHQGAVCSVSASTGKCPAPPAVPELPK